MNTKQHVSFIFACAAAVTLADGTTDNSVRESASEPAAEMRNDSASPWRFSVGTRFAPGVKVRAGISRSAFSTHLGRISFAGPEKSSDREAVSVADSSSSTTETGSLAAQDGRYEFEAGFIDMNDSAGIEGETWYWHLDDTASFDEGSGTFTIPLSGSTDSDSVERNLPGTRSSDTIDITGSDGRSDDDLWGFDAEIGYDFLRSSRWTLGLGFGVSLYEDIGAFRMANRYRKTTRSETDVRQVQDSALTISEKAFLTDPAYAGVGTAAGLRNDDGSYGAGTYDGLDNPYGGYNPVISVSGIPTEKQTDARIRTTTRSRIRESSLTIDMASRGTVSTREFRLAIQSAYRVADQLELRGALGAVLTHVDLDVDSSISVNGKPNRALSTSDDGFVFAGLLGLDAVLSPRDWIDCYIGADLRLGPNDWDFDTGLVQGTVELSRATYRAGVSIRF